jgi:hypothetical protein
MIFDMGDMAYFVEIWYVGDGKKWYEYCLKVCRRDSYRVFRKVKVWIEVNDISRQHIEDADLALFISKYTSGNRIRLESAMPFKAILLKS